jgi:hypothetical protein
VIKEENLSLKAIIITQYETALQDDIVAYTNIISIAILRDWLSKADMKILKISKFYRISKDFPYYIITFDLKSRHLFWTPKITEKIINELSKINENLMQAKNMIDVYSVDQSEERWKEKGHMFLNEISEWNMEDLFKAIEKQIMSGNIPKA